MTDFTEEFDNHIGLERGSYARFDVLHNTRRPGQAPGKIDDLSTMQLPNGSVLHTVNGFDTLTSPAEGVPDETFPLVVNESLPVYLRVTNEVAKPTSLPFGVNESFIYRPASIQAHVMHFYQTHKKFHRVLSDRTLSSMAGVLTWVDYSPLNEMKVTGLQQEYRKFDIIFRTMLDKIVQIGPGKHHYIAFPQKNEQMVRTKLQRTFKELSTGTLNVLKHDPSLFPLIHLLGYVYGKTKELDVTPYKEDVKILGKADKMFDEVKSTSLLERLPKEILSTINFVLYHGNRAVVYNLGDLTKFAQDETFYVRMYRHLMHLRGEEGDLTVIEDSDNDVDGVSDEIVDKVEATPVVVSTPVEEPVKQAPKAEPVAVKTVTEIEKETTHFAKQSQPKTFEERLRTKLVDNTKDTVADEPKKISKRDQLTETHLNTVIGGKPIAEWIGRKPITNVKPKNLEFLNSSEESYHTSSLVAIDQAYHTELMHTEMVKIISSLAQHGMFVSKVEEDVVHTEMDRTTTYKVHLSDLNGKSHYVKYTLPIIDEHGVMKLSGIDYRMTRQIANVPICKISPTRVNLSSYYNKIIVERIESKRNNYGQQLLKFLSDLKAQGLVDTVLGTSPYPANKAPNDYSALGQHFTEIQVKDYTFDFTIDHSKEPSSSYGVRVGQGKGGETLYWNFDNTLHLVVGKQVKQSWASFLSFLEDQLGEEGRIDKVPVEWTQARILNKRIPLVYILSYQMGLKKVLETIGLQYTFYESSRKLNLKVDDIAIRFADGILVFNRYPLSRSLIATGLSWIDLRKFTFSSLSLPDTYPDLFSMKGMSVGVLKGLKGFYDFFVDPITEAVLEKMGEPIVFSELLLRANIMLSDFTAQPSSSVSLHRFRSFERFNGILYNEISRGLQTYRNNTSSRKSFSINPEAVFQQIVQDATVSPNDMINPVHEVKQKSSFTYTGRSGRIGRSLVERDLVYPEDAVGIISEAVPDSGKVGINAYLSASPRIEDVHGLPKPYTPQDDVTGPQLLSIAGMLMPASTSDDGKRANYTGIQISHYVPNAEEGETLSIRTGYEPVLAHITSDVFAVTAKEDGVVEAIDTVNKVVRIRYADTLHTALRKLRLPIVDVSVENSRKQNKTVGFLVSDKDIHLYPQGGIFELTRTTYGKIIDRLRCNTPEAIPDKDVAKRQAGLVKDLEKGRYGALYFIRFSLMHPTIPGQIKSHSFADVYSQNSGSHLLQKRAPNVKVGETFKQGDVLIYNEGFFVPDPLSKQVTFKHGVTANVALVEKSTNLEDACEISQDMADRLKMSPCHQRQVITKADATLLNSVSVGDHVETSTSLCVISDSYLIGDSTEIDLENIDIFEKLNRQTPQAGYTGTIHTIRILYSCDRDKLSDSLKTVLKTYEKEVRNTFKALNSDPTASPPDKPGWVAPGSRYQGLEFAEDTVVLEYMIGETIGMSQGDKLVVGLSSKSIVSHVNEKPHKTESGEPVDILFSTTGIINRVVASPFVIGIAEKVMLKLKRTVVDDYFSK